MACEMVSARVLIFVTVLSFGVVAHQNTRARNNEIPQLTGTITSEDIRKSQKEFFHRLENTPGLKESKNVSTTIQILNTVEGQKLMRTLVDSLVPTIGRDDSRELLHNFWILLSEAVPDKVAHKLKQIEDLYGEIDSLPAALFSLITAGDQSPIALILQEVIPNFNASELLQSVTPTPSSNLPGQSFATRLLHLVKPAIDTFFKENEIDLQADAIIQMVASLTSQFQGTAGNENQTSVGKVREKPRKNNGGGNPLAALLPLLGVMGKSQGKNGNKLMEGLLGMIGNGDGENVFGNLFSMLGQNGDKNNILESFMGFLSGGKSGDKSIVDSVLDALNGGGKAGENNVAESVLGMLNGGKTGDNNLMGMAMALMNGMSKNKKHNENLDMIASVVSLMSAANGNDEASERNPMAGIAKMAIDMLGQTGSKKNGKQDKINQKKTIAHEKTKPTDSASTQLKKEHRKAGSVSSFSANIPKSRLLQVMEPALRRLQDDASCHAKLAAVLSAGKTFLDTKAMGAKAFLYAAVPVAIAGLPGGPALLQEFGAALDDLGLKDKQLSQVLTAISEDGECVTLARRAAPHVGKLLLLLAEPHVQEIVWSTCAEQVSTALEGLGLKGVTLSNWPQILGPMMNMGAAGLPVKPVPLLSALQDHITDVMRSSKQQLQLIRGLPLSEVVPNLEYELGSLLHHLGNVEHHLSQREAHETICIAQVVCTAAQRHKGLKGSISTSYSVVRGIMAVSASVPARLEVLLAATRTGDCQDELPCAPLPLADTASARHASLDYDEAAAHVEL